MLPYPIKAPSRSINETKCNYLDDFGRSAIADFHDVIDVVAHRDKQIEKQFASNLHLHLHGSAPLESLTTSNDQG
jgi:hypothetical protein